MIDWSIALNALIFFGELFLVVIGVFTLGTIVYAGVVFMMGLLNIRPTNEPSEEFIRWERERHEQFERERREITRNTWR